MVGEGLAAHRTVPQMIADMLSVTRKSMFGETSCVARKNLPVNYKPIGSLTLDADEFRESPFRRTTLSEGLKIVGTAYGYNAVNFELLNFRPVDNSFVSGEDVREYLTQYEPGDWFDSNQIKAWKKTSEKVDLVSTAGHNIQFANRMLFPVNFILRHYPIRSEQHGRKKVYADRIARFSKEERAVGWHVQYDDVVANKKSFLHDPTLLIPYDAAGVRVALFSKATRSTLLSQTNFAHVVHQHEDVLRQRPNDIQALKGLTTIALQFGDRQAANSYVSKLEVVAPADAEVNTSRLLGFNHRPITGTATAGCGSV